MSAKYVFKYERDEGDEIRFEFSEYHIGEVVQRFGHFLIGIGFQYENVSQYLNHEYFPPRKGKDKEVEL